MFDQNKHDSLEEISTCMVEAGAITRKAKITPEDSTRFNFLQQKISLLKAGMTPDQFRQKQMTDLINSGEVRPFEFRKQSSAETKAYMDFLRSGVGNRQMVSKNGVIEMRAQLAGQAAISSSTGSAGGYFVPSGFYGAKLFEAQKAYDALFDPNVATHITTGSSIPLLVSSVDDTANPATILTESSTDSGGDFTAGQLTLQGYSFRTKKLIYSREFDEDSFWPIATLLEKSAAKRISIGVSKYLATGTGIGQPTGLVTACENAGATVTTANPSSITYADLENLFDSVDPAYRANGTWLLNDSTLKAVRALSDASQRPLIDVTADGLTLFGRPVRLSPSMDSISTSKAVIAFGDLSYFLVRRCISGEYALIYNQSAALVEAGLSAARFFVRYDSDLITFVSGSPVSVLRMFS